MYRVDRGLAWLLCLIGLGVSTGTAQVAQESAGVPAATRWMMDAAGATQRNSIRSVFLLVCPVTQKKGT
jgi:hypothetical protein